MAAQSGRRTEIRLIVLATINLTDSELLDELSAKPGRTVADVVTDEIATNLESVSYVDAAIVSRL